MLVAKHTIHEARATEHLNAAIPPGATQRTACDFVLGNGLPGSVEGVHCERLILRDCRYVAPSVHCVAGRPNQSADCLLKEHVGQGPGQVATHSQPGNVGPLGHHFDSDNPAGPVRVPESLNFLSRARHLIPHHRGVVPGNRLQHRGDGFGFSIGVHEHNAARVIREEGKPRIGVR